MTSCNLSHIQ
uniref:LRH-1 protein n=1 Tax=Mus musculus TaxID=10090 RepID=Q61807_MOUSE|nr:ORF [Mus musculus]